MKRILVAEDENSIRDFIVINLKRNGYDVVEAVNGQEALDLYSSYNGEFDIALLDIMMPYVDGLDVCMKLRQSSSTLGIIMLTAKTQEMDKVTGLLSGADDYITKPFSPSELMARIDSVYRRVRVNRGSDTADAPDELRQGDFVLSIRNRNLRRNDEIIELTQVEFQIMEYFFTNPNTTLSRTDILKQVWGVSFFGDEKIVDVNIRRLRIKIENDASNPAYIITVWGRGYKWTN